MRVTDDNKYQKKTSAMKKGIRQRRWECGYGGGGCVSVFNGMARAASLRKRRIREVSGQGYEDRRNNQGKALTYYV